MTEREYIEAELSGEAKKVFEVMLRNHGQELAQAIAKATCLTDMLREQEKCATGWMVKAQDLEKELAAEREKVKAVEGNRDHWKEAAIGHIRRATDWHEKFKQAEAERDISLSECRDMQLRLQRVIEGSEKLEAKNTALKEAVSGIEKAWDIMKCRLSRLHAAYPPRPICSSHAHIESGSDFWDAAIAVDKQWDALDEAIPIPSSVKAAQEKPR